MEDRIRKLERNLEQQSYIVLVLMVVVIVDTAGLLVLWGEKGRPDYDHIAVSMTVFQTLFGIAALYGFWALRGLTREKAEETAAEEVGKIAPPLIRREVRDFLGTIPQESPISDVDVDAMAAAAGDDAKEGDDEKE